MSTLYNWVDNKLKFDRAKAKVGDNASEYELQREYIALGGKVIGEPLEAPVAPRVEIKEPINEVKAPVKAPKVKAVKPRK